jgi:protein phosphatase PTC7
MREMWSRETAKCEEKEQASLRFINGLSAIPHDQKRHKGGEDAWFLSEKMIAVADGVGGWEAQGVDSGIYSRALCKFIGKIYGENTSKPLREILIEAAKENKEMGSSTAVLLKVEPDSDVIHTTNLGDSGYRIFRPNDAGYDLIFASKEQ